MGTLIQVGQLLLSLTILVFVHELGHFLAARMFGIRVKKFYLFFDFLFPMPSVLNFALFKKKIGDTEYGLGWFPLGGYVQIGGMVDESMDEEEMNAPMRDDDYRSKPIWQRFIVMIGGIVMNVIFGVIFYTLFIGLFKKEYVPATEFNKYGVYTFPLADTIGFKMSDKILSIDGKTPVRTNEDMLSTKLYLAKTVLVEREGKEVTIDIPGKYFKRMAAEPFLAYMRNTVYVDSAIVGSEASNKGLKKNDTIVAIDSMPLLNFDQFKYHLAQHKLKSISLTLNNNGVLRNIQVTPDTAGTIGFMSGIASSNFYSTKKYTTSEILSYGVKDAFGIITLQIKGYAKLFSGQLPVRESVSSPIGMTKLFSKQWDWARFFLLTAIISMALAFGNLLPIPALDGGHIVILGIEAIIRKPINPKILEKIQTVGMVILLGLMAFTFGNDILKLFGI
jgi:regulator of sigma E protease